MVNRPIVFLLSVLILISLVAPLSSAAYWTPASPTAYWKFDTSSGNAIDTTGKHNLTNYGSTPFVQGILGNGVNITSASNYFSGTVSGDFDWGTNNFTIAFWYKANGVSPSTYLAAIFRTDSTFTNPTRVTAGINRFASWGTQGAAVITNVQPSGFNLSGSGLEDGNWHRVVMSRENIGTNGLKFYIDGVNTGNVTFDTDVGGTYDTDYLGIGGTQDVDVSPNGVIDELAIFRNYSFTPSDVSYDYNSGNGRSLIIPTNWTTNYNTGLRGFWTYNETSGSKIDSLGLYNITLTGGTLSTPNGLINASWVGDATNSGTVNATLFTGVGGKWTYSVWFYSSAWASARYLLWTSDSSSYLIIAENNAPQTADDMTVYFNGVTTSLGVTTADSTWHHLVITADNSTQRLITYWDGVLKTNVSSGAFNNIAAATTPKIGGHDAGPGYSLTANMRMDEMGIWNRTLNSSEITNLYNYGNGLTFKPVPPPQNASWQLNITSPINGSTYTNYVTSLNYSILNVSAGYTSCYQESANVTNQTGIDGSCGLSYSGIYWGWPFSWEDTWGSSQPASNIFDGNWSTYSDVSQDGPVYNYINYTFPSQTPTAAIWSIKDGVGHINYTLPSLCLRSDGKVIIQVSAGGFPSVQNYDCLNSSGGSYSLATGRTGGGLRIYDEAMIWSQSGTSISCKYSLNGGILNITSNCSSSYFGTFISGLMARYGSNTWTVYAEESGYLPQEARVYFNMYTPAPVINITSPLNGSIINSYQNSNSTNSYWLGRAPTIYYKFNNSINDSSGNGRNLTVSGTGNSFISNGKLGQARIFGGTNGDSTTYTPTFYTNNFTIAFWFNQTAHYADHQGIMGTGGWANANTWEVVIPTNGINQDKIGLQYDIPGVPISVTSPIIDGLWHRVVFVREGTGSNLFKVYVDGVLNNTSTLNVNFSVQNGLSVGSLTSNVYPLQPGNMLDDVQIFDNYAWTPAQVLTDYNGGTGREADSGGFNPNAITYNITVNESVDLSSTWAELNSQSSTNTVSYSAITPGMPYQTSYTPQNTIKGWGFVVYRNYSLVNVTRYSLTGCSYVRVSTAASGTPNLREANFTGYVATFNPPLNLTAGSKYFVLYMNTGNCDHAVFGPTDLPIPNLGSNSTWIITSNSNDGGEETNWSSRSIYNFLSVGLSEQISPAVRDISCGIKDGNTYPCSASMTPSQGYNFLTVFANDSVGALGNSTISFFYDSIAPTINATAPPAVINPNGSMINFTANISDGTIPSQLKIASWETGANTYFLATPSRKGGQTFTANSSYTLKSVGINILRVGTPGTITVSLYATNISTGLPIGSALIQNTTVNADNFDTSYRWENITFENYSLTSGTKYAIVFELIPSGELRWPTKDGSPSYPDGDCIDNIGSWATCGPNPNEDIYFQVWAEPLNTNSGIKNVTLDIRGTTTNGTSYTNTTILTYAQDVFTTVVSIPVSLADGFYSWFMRVFDWAGNQAVTNSTIADRSIPISVSGVVTDGYNYLLEYIPTTYSSNNCLDYKFVQSNGADIGSWLEYYNSTNCRFWANITSNSTFYLKYGTTGNSNIDSMNRKNGSAGGDLGGYSELGTPWGQKIQVGNNKIYIKNFTTYTGSGATRGWITADGYRCNKTVILTDYCYVNSDDCVFNQSIILQNNTRYNLCFDAGDAGYLTVSGNGWSPPSQADFTWLGGMGGEATGSNFAYDANRNYAVNKLTYIIVSSTPTFTLGQPAAPNLNVDSTNPLISYGAGTTWFNTNYNKKKLISYTSASAQTNFVMPVYLNSSNFNFADSINGSDVMFVNGADNTELTSFLEYYNATQQKATYWIVTDISIGTNSFYAYYNSTQEATRNNTIFGYQNAAFALPLGENTGTTLFDRSSNNKNFTRGSATSWVNGDVLMSTDATANNILTSQANVITTANKTVVIRANFTKMFANAGALNKPFGLFQLAAGAGGWETYLYNAGSGKFSIYHFRTSGGTSDYWVEFPNSYLNDGQFHTVTVSWYGVNIPAVPTTAYFNITIDGRNGSAISSSGGTGGVYSATNDIAYTGYTAQWAADPGYNMTVDFVAAYSAKDSGWEKLMADSLQGSILTFGSSTTYSGYTNPAAGSNISTSNVAVTVSVTDQNANFSTSGAWWNSSFTARKAITISPATTVVNQSVLVTVPYSSEMKTNFGDLRFTTTSGQELGYWFYNNTCNTGVSCDVWVRIPTVGTSSIYTYYGNSAASTTSNISNAFIFGEDFNGAIDWTNKWYSGNQGLYTTNNGLLTMTPTSTLTNKLSNRLSFSGGYSIETRMSSANMGQTDIYTLPAEQSISSWNGEDASDIGYVGGSNNFRVMLNYGNPPGGNCNTGTGTSNTFYRMKWTITSSYTNSFGGWSTDNLDSICNVTGQSYRNSGYIGFMNYPNPGSADSYMDWVYVRPSVSSEPTATLGSQELLGGAVVFTMDGSASRVSISSCTVTNTTWPLLPTYSCTQSYSGLSQGLHNYSASFTDLLGLTNTTEMRTFFVDTTAPTVSGLIPLNNTYMNIGNQTINASSPITLGLQTYYSFSEGSGTSTADSLGIHNFTGLSGSIWTTGKLGNGYQPSGQIAQDMGVGTNVGQTGFTINGWIKFVGTPSQNCHIWRNNLGNHVPGLIAGSYLVDYLGTGNRLAYEFKDDSNGGLNQFVYTPLLNNSQWYMFTSSINATHYTLFLDGQYVNSIAKNNFQFVDANMSLFRNPPYSNCLMSNTVMDEFAMFNRTLSLSEIQQLYNNGNAVSYEQFSSSQYYIGNVTFNATAIDGITNNQVFQNGLVSYHSFDSVTPLVDQVNSSYSLTDNSSYRISQSLFGKNGNAMRTNNSLVYGDRLTFGYSPMALVAGGNTYSISFWEYQDGISPNGYGTSMWYGTGGGAGNSKDMGIAGWYYPGFEKIWVAGGGAYWGALDIPGIPGTLKNNTWHHIVMIMNSTNVSVYENGVFRGSDIWDSSGFDFSNTNPAYLFYGFNGDSYMGPSPNTTLDEFGVWNRALNVTEIQTLYNNGTGLFYTTPISGSGINTATLNITGTNAAGQAYSNETTISVGGLTQSVVSIPVALMDGVYRWFIRVVDMAGNIGTSQTNNLYLDSVAPVVNITYPTSGITNTNVSNITFTVYDGTFADKVWFTSNGGVTNTSLFTCNATYNCSLGTIFVYRINATEGNNAWTVYANDTVGNLGSSTVSFLLDRNAPTITGRTPINNSFINPGNATCFAAHYVKQINITSTDSVASNNVSVLLNISYESQMQSDFSDLYFYDDQNNSVGFWFYNNTCINGVSCQVWVKPNGLIGGGNNATIFMEYGGPSTYGSNITRAFMLGDDFSGTSIAWNTKWNSTSKGSFSQSGDGWLNQSVTTNDNGFMSVNTYSDYIWEARSQFPTFTGTDGQNTQLIPGLTWVSSNALHPYSGAFNQVFVYINPTQTNTGSVVSGDIVRWYMAANKSELRLNMTTDNGLQLNAMSGIPANIGSENITVSRILTAREGSGITRWDWMYIRRFVNVEPTYTIDANATSHIYCGGNVTFNATITDPGLSNNAVFNQLVSYYNFSEQTGVIAKDIVSGTYNGTITAGTGGLWNISGFIGGTYQYGGINTKIDLPNSAQLVNQSNMTWSVWVKPTLASCSGSYDTIMMGGDITGGDIVDVRFISNTCLLSAYSPSPGSDCGNISLTPNNWNHVVLTNTAGNKKLYVNGLLSCDAASAWQNGLYETRIGSGFNGEYTGLIDEVGIWNKALNSTEISTLYNSGTGLTYYSTSTTPSGIKNITLTVNGNLYDGEPFTYTNTTNFSVGTVFTTIISIPVVLTDGVYTWFTSAWDWAGNNIISPIFGLTIDTVSPELTIDYPLDGGQYNYFVTNMTFTVTHGGQATPTNIWFTNDSGVTNYTILSNTNFTGTMTVLNLTSSNGANTWELWINNTVGHTNYHVHTFYVDTVFPTVYYTGATPQNGTYRNTSTIPFAINAYDVNLKNITSRLYNSTGLFASSTNSTVVPSNVTWTSSFTGVDDTYWINSTACDTFTNCNNSETRQFIVDLLSPVLTFVNATTSTGGVTTTLWANVSINEKNIQDIVISLNQIPPIYTNTTTINNRSLFTTNPYYAFMNWTNLDEGDYNYIFTVRDMVNHTTTIIRNVSIDGTPPNVTFVAPTPIAVSVFNYIPVNVTADDIHYANMTIYLTNSSGSVINTTFTTSANKYLQYNVVDGDYVINATAFDTLNNQGWSENRAIHKEFQGAGISLCRGSISLPGQYYMTANITANITEGGACLSFDVPDIYLDCRGHSITLNINSTAIAMTKVNNYLTNCRIVVPSGGTGIRITNNSAATISNSFIDGFYGVYLENSFATITNSTIANNVYGLFVTGRATLNVINETSFINSTGYRLAASNTWNFRDVNVTAAYNTSSGALIAPGNYILSANQSTITNATSVNWNNVRLSYSYAYDVPDTKATLTDVLFSSNTYGIYHNYTANFPGGSTGWQVWGPSGAGAYTRISFTGGSNPITLIGSSYNVFNGINSATGNVLYSTRSSNNAMTNGNFVGATVTLTGGSITNTFHDTNYSSESVDSTSSLTRSWTSTVRVIDRARDPVRGGTVRYTDANGNNHTITTDQNGNSIDTITDYTNIYGNVTGKNPYDLIASYQNLQGSGANANISYPFNTTLTINNDVTSTPMSRTAMRILLGIILLIGLAASTGFFVVKMRNGDSVVDIWKYFIIMIIWDVIFLVLFLVLSKYVMAFVYPNVPN